MKRTTGLAVALALTVGLLAAGAALAVTDGQVTRGAAVYEQSCATCHGPTGNDGFATPLKGLGTLVRFASTRELYEFTSTTMPLAAEGSLTQRQYLDVTAWLLVQRGQPSGAAELTLATLDNVPLHPGAAATPTAVPTPAAIPAAAPAPAATPTATLALEQWPTTCVDLNDIVEAHLGNDGNVGIYQRVFGDEAEQGCQNDHRDDVRGVFGWAFDQTAQSADSGPQDLAWPTDCVALNDIVEKHLGNHGNVGIYQRTFGAQGETACRNDHRDDVRGVFGWAFGGATSGVVGLPLSTDEIVARNQGAGRFIQAGDVCGSGAVVTRDGYVVTNRHVVEGTRAVQVGTYLGRKEQAHVVATHADLDLALLKLSSGGPPPFVAFDSSADLRLGEDLVILGYPLCLETLTTTRGILSARHPQVLQTDATANPGHSGSPGFSSRGGVIGVVTAKWGDDIENTNFLIEGDLVRTVVEDWIIRRRAGTLS